MALVGSPIGKPWGRRLPVSVGGAVAPFQGADFVMDFANGYYRRGATVGTSPADIAATVNGTATINSSGLLCDASGESVSFSYAIAPASSFIVVSDYAAQTASNTARIFIFDNGGNPNLISLYKNGTDTVSQSTSLLSAPYALSGKVANGFNATEHVVSFAGSAVQKASKTPPDFSTGTKYVGNLLDGTQPALVPIRSFAIYLGVFSDAQIQALAT